MAKKQSDRPVAEFKQGQIKVAVWRNETERGPRYSFTVCRFYKNDDDEWQTTQTFNESDAPNLAFAIARANLFIQDERDEETEGSAKKSGRKAA